MKKVTFVHPLVSRTRTFGERASDGLARYAGSWVFIISFLIFLGLWMLVNIYAWVNTWDPYPFILLNLVLSCIAALQAPIILMSQNRQSEKDRLKVDYDYRVNRKAERGIERILLKVNALEARLLGKKNMSTKKISKQKR